MGNLAVLLDLETEKGLDPSIGTKEALKKLAIRKLKNLPSEIEIGTRTPILAEINDKLKKIPVVMLTSSALQNDINYAYNNHVNCYIVKSGNLKDFMDTINSIERFWMHCVTYPKTG